MLNNLLYDASQVGIPADNVDEEYLTTPRQWNIQNIRRFMVFIGPMSSIFDYATFFLMLYFFKCKLYSHAATTPEMKTYYESLFHTGWFVESILTQTLIVHIIRTNRIPFLQSIASPFLLLADNHCYDRRWRSSVSADRELLWLRPTTRELLDMDRGVPSLLFGVNAFG